jgi:release factor glutamine methyltransferase
VTGLSPDLKSQDGIATIAEALDRTAAALCRAGLAEARREARLLLALAAGIGAETIIGHPERPLEQAAIARLDEFVARRVRREPVSRIAGRREFWSLSFEVTPATLDPRPDSETLVEAALDLIEARSAPLSLLDLGTGTGCLLLALLSELPGAWGVGVDISPDATMAARRNAAALGLAGRAAFAVGDWGTSLAGGFDLVVANPPYIASGAMAGLPPEVAAYDPPLALVGGRHGLDAYQSLTPDLLRLVRPGATVLLEIGAGQAAAVRGILARAGFENAAVYRDLAGIERCVAAWASR